MCECVLGWMEAVPANTCRNYTDTHTLAWTWKCQQHPSKQSRSPPGSPRLLDCGGYIQWIFVLRRHRCSAQTQPSLRARVQLLRSKQEYESINVLYPVWLKNNNKKEKKKVRLYAGVIFSKKNLQKTIWTFSSVDFQQLAAGEWTPTRSHLTLFFTKYILGPMGIEWCVVFVLVCEKKKKKKRKKKMNQGELIKTNIFFSNWEFFFL